MHHFLQRLARHLPQRLRILPTNAVGIILLLLAVNVFLWVIVAIVLRFHPLLVTTALLSYTLGLRHALDADHISAIDLMTRRLVATGSKPVTVGTWFSLGHSTIVIITCIVVAATSGALEDRFDGFSQIGGIIGTSVSAGVLLILGIGNAWLLWRLIVRLRVVLNEEANHDQVTSTTDLGLDFENGGLLVRVFKRAFKLVDRPWKMYPLGVLFGLGFDTSSEIAILGIASIQGAQATSLWIIMIFPILFTAGMCLLDTTDGALMMALYTSTALARDTIAILYYSITLSAVTVVVAVFIGIAQLLSLVTSVTTVEGPFWDGVNTLEENFDIVGGSICGTFVVSGLLSVVLYKPWRRRMDRSRRKLHTSNIELSALYGFEDGERKDGEKDRAVVATRDVSEDIPA